MSRYAFDQACADAETAQLDAVRAAVGADVTVIKVGTAIDGRLVFGFACPDQARPATRKALREAGYAFGDWRPRDSGHHAPSTLRGWH